MSLRIELAGPIDEDVVLALLRGQFDEHDIHLEEPALRAAVRGPLVDPSRGAFLVARLGASVSWLRTWRCSAGVDGLRTVGLAYLTYTWTLEHGGRSAWLEELYVSPDARAGGVGTALLRAALAHAARVGCAAVDLEVEADHSRAANLYAREGFVARTRARWYRRL